MKTKIILEYYKNGELIIKEFNSFLEKDKFLSENVDENSEFKCRVEFK